MWILESETDHVFCKVNADAEASRRKRGLCPILHWHSNYILLALASIAVLD
jgi:hypothetical protein